jgi:ABC-2 type transport system ATP-binding protein
VSEVEVTGSVVRCQVLGPIEPLLKVLAEAGVKELLSQEASLEQLFLAHYGPKAAQKRPGAVTGAGP